MTSIAKSNAIDRRSLLHRAVAGAAGAAIGAPAAAAADPFALARPLDDDAKVAALFEQWKELVRQDAPSDACLKIQDEIFECRGRVAFALKTFLYFRHDLSTWTQDGTCIRFDRADFEDLSKSWETAILRDVADAFPPLSEQLEAVLHEDARLISAEMELQWVSMVLADADARNSPTEWIASVREREREAIDLIRNTPARTPRGEAIKLAYANAGAVA